MLTELHVENFKAWRDLKIELGKVTALFGENSSGKSSLLQFLLMLKQTKNAADRGVVLDFGGGPTELVNLGNYATAVHREGRADTLPDMKWTLAWRLPRELRIYDPLAVPRELLYAGDELQASALVGPKTDSQSQPSAKRLAYEFDGTTFELRPERPGGRDAGGCGPPQRPDRGREPQRAPASSFSASCGGG